MNAARRSDGLLSAKQTISLLGLIKRHPSGQPEQLLLRDLAASYPAAWSKGRNTIALLLDLEILAGKDESVWIRDIAYESAGWEQSLGNLIAKRLLNSMGRNGAGSCLQADGNGALWLDAMLLPGAAEGFPLWVIEFSIATRERIGSRFWRVAEPYVPLFLAGARRANRDRIRRAISAAELDAQLEADAIHGRIAEEWVVAYEQARLAAHPLADQIRRVSDEDVGAGYDIVSFSAGSILHHDLFIEVKSYTGAKRFFWTRNELETARSLGENYSLYLIDRSRMNSSSYEPHIIRGPYTALFDTHPSGWTISPTTFECVAPPGA